MRVWPNPVVGRRFHLQAPELPAGGYVTEVHGSDGRQVLRKPWTHAGGGAILRVDLPWGMPSGRYTVRVLRDGRQLLQAAVLVE
jgi:hypothetical protein